MIRSQVLLTPTLFDLVRQVALKEERSFSATIRSLLEEALVLRRKKKTAGGLLLEMARKASDKGPRDLSTNDDYLYKIS